MQCEDTKILLSTYIDKELPEEQEQLVEAHLLDCPDCAAALARLQEVVAAVRETPRLKLPPGAAQRLAAAVDARLAADHTPAAPEKRAPWWHWLARPAFMSVATAVGVVAVAVALWQIPAQKSDWGVRKAPSGQRAPQVQENRKILSPSLSPEGAARKLGPSLDELGKDFAHIEKDGLSIPESKPAVVTKQAINALLSQAVIGKLQEKGDGNADKKALSDQEMGFVGNSAGPVSLDAAARIAAADAPRQLLEAASGLYDGQVAWIVVLERTDKPGIFIGAAVGQKDGRVLYRKTTQRP